MKTKENKKELFYGLKIAIPMIFYVLATVSPMLLRIFIPVSNTDYISTSLKLIILFVATCYLIPFKIGIPMQVQGRKNLIDIGLLSPEKLPASLLMGLLFGLLSLSFMLLGSLLSGDYVFHPSTLDLQHMYFSLVPGIFEEVIFRGFIMIVLIKYLKSIKKAMVLQAVLFTLSHVKDISPWGIVDILTVGVIAVAFTYVVLRTGNLYAAIIFHFIHDAFLFVVQLPEGSDQSNLQHLLFYASIWLGMFLIMLLVRLLTGDIDKQRSSNIYLKALHESKNMDRVISDNGHHPRS